MYKIISKREYFSWLNNGNYIDLNPRLKSIQDAFVLSHLSNKKNLRIAEIGGGNSRVLKRLSVDNECWNIDKFEGVGQGPTVASVCDDITTIKAYLGEFSEEIPSNYFDCVFSISVVEHVPNRQLDSFFLDLERILRPGGIMIHAIDCYLSDENNNSANWMKYIETVSRVCRSLVLIEPASINAELKFSTAMASDPDINMWKRNNLVPKLSGCRERAQCISIEAGWRKEERPSITREVEEVLVYQMGKVASSSIRKTLQKSGFKVRHFHYFNWDFIGQEKSTKSALGIDDIKAQKVKIVTLTRDPVARNISAFFQNIEVFTGPSAAETDVSQLIEAFLSKYHHLIPLNWFDEEFRTYTGVDVYEHKFDKDLGYSKILQDDVQVLLIKSEVSDTTKLLALNNFLCGGGRQISKMETSNQALDKTYSVLYKKFIGSVTFDTPYLEMMYGSQYAKHFYSDKEIETFISRWRRK